MDGRIHIERDLNQRRKGRIARELNGLQQGPEGQALMLVGIQQGLLNTSQHFGKRLFGVHTQAQGKQVRAMPHQVLPLHQLLSGRRDSDDHVLLSGQTVQQDGIDGQQGGEQGAFLTRAKVLDRSAQRLPNHRHLHCALEGPHRRSG